MIYIPEITVSGLEQDGGVYFARYDGNQVQSIFAALEADYPLTEGDYLVHQVGTIAVVWDGVRYEVPIYYDPCSGHYLEDCSYAIGGLKIATYPYQPDTVPFCLFVTEYFGAIFIRTTDSGESHTFSVMDVSEPWGDGGADEPDEDEPSHELPEGYVEVEYIESTGTQWIDTGIANWNQTIEYEIKLGIRQQKSGVTTSYFGCFDVWSASGSNLPNISTYNQYRAAASFNAGVSSASGTDIGIANGQTGVFSLKGDSISWSEGTATPFDRSKTFTNAKSIMLFCVSASGTATEHASSPLYYAKFWLNGDLIRGFVPCMTPSGEVGLWDKVDGKFYGNSGTGSFLVPATRLEYIESTGTQYINTGVIPNQNTGFDVDFITYNAIAADVAGGANGYGSIFGARSSSRVRELQLTTYTSDYVRNFGTLRYGTAEYNPGLEIGTRTVAIFRNGAYSNSLGTSFVVTPTEFESPVPLTVFALNNGGSVGQNGNVRIYSLKLYDGDTLIRDYVPYLNTDGQIGFWDNVEGVFYGNSGSGAFTPGPVAPVAPEVFDTTTFLSGLTMGLCGEGVANITPDDIFAAGYMLGVKLRNKRPSPDMIPITGDASGLVYDFDQNKLHLSVTDTGVPGNTFSLVGYTLTVNNAVTFTIADAVGKSVEMQTEPGLTWGEWLNTPYNAISHPTYSATKLAINSEGLVSLDYGSGNGSLVYVIIPEFVVQTADDVIVPGMQYVLYDNN